MSATTDHTRAALSTETSEAIRVARVLCITGMISVHVWPGAGAILSAETSQALHALYLVMIDYVGRGSVPLLSIVSGALLTLSLQNTALPELFWAKVRKLLWPMLMWSSAMLLLASTYGIGFGASDRLPNTLPEFFNAILALSDNPINRPLGFLRDIFVAFAGALALHLILQRRMKQTAFALLAWALVENLWGQGLLLRPQILSFFALGFCFSIAGLFDRVPSWWTVVGLLAIDWGIRFSDVAEIPHIQLAADYLHRAAVALAFWRLTIVISRSRGPLLARIKFLEQHIFVIFCTHFITIFTCGAVAKMAGMTVDNGWYVLWFFGQIVLSVIVGIAISIQLSRLNARGPFALARHANAGRQS